MLYWLIALAALGGVVLNIRKSVWGLWQWTRPAIPREGER